VRARANVHHFFHHFVSTVKITSDVTVANTIKRQRFHGSVLKGTPDESKSKRKGILGDRIVLTRKDFRLSPRQMFLYRLQHSMLILAVLTYLKVATLAFQSLYCIKIESPAGTKLRLETELSTVCWEGSHLGVAFFTILVLLPFITAMPLLLLRRLRVNFAEGALSGGNRTVLFGKLERYGFMVRQLLVRSARPRMRCRRDLCRLFAR
jgi:hypothetical protein